MKTLAAQLHALTLDHCPTPKPGALMLHRVALIPAGCCRICWTAGGRAIQLEPTCPRCGNRMPQKTVDAMIQKHREENR